MFSQKQTEPMYTAYYQAGRGWMPVTLGGELFKASKGLLEDMVERMKEKHPGTVFTVQPVR